GSTTTTYNQVSLPVTVSGPGVQNTITGVTHTARTSYSYDDRGNPLTQAVSDLTGGDATRTTSYGYDSAGRLHTPTNADNQTTTQNWSQAGDVVEVIPPAGASLRYLYDDAHRPLTTTAIGPNVDPQTPGATSLVLQARSYDPAGRLAALVDAAG